ncbi:Uncharacterised protein [Mycobacterium tuberculosis]|uniref:Uncharacterized protein n=1 Tax=Mycobacterium tuberculosis TaxID=1773 RepID=A0A916LCG1_MYCTX|nr:Uncharacterised protein [Mycobacterium tuberculosis]
MTGWALWASRSCNASDAVSDPYECPNTVRWPLGLLARTCCKYRDRSAAPACACPSVMVCHRSPALPVSSGFGGGW